MKIFTAIVFLWYCTYQGSVDCKAAFSGSYIVGSFNDIVKGVGKQIPNIIPTPEELFQVSKQVLFGLPEVAIFKTINKLCSLYLESDNIDPRVTPNMNKIMFQLRTPCKNQSFPITHAEQILESPDFDVNKKVVLFVTGWMSSIESDYIGDMAKAYHCRGGYNFLALNTSNAITTLYSWSAFNTEEVGRILAEGLEKLAEQVPIENIHLIGHSLGAHIVGSAGRYFSASTGLNITRITALDPANPCFNEGESLSGLQRGDGAFVDVIHSNPGVLGKSDPVGDADFYPGGLAPLKPGCTVLGCSHGRAYEYYIESVYPGNETDFLGVRCTSLSKLDNGFCDGPKFPMGYAVPYDLKGNYFLAVNSKQPYGQNANAEQGTLESSECGKCGNSRFRS